MIRTTCFFAALLTLPATALANPPAADQAEPAAAEGPESAVAEPAPAEPAGLPPAARAMIDAALESGDAQKVATAVELARKAFPEHDEEVDAIASAFDEKQKLAAAAKAEAELEALRSAGVFERWTGSGEIGAFRATGNSDDVGLAASLEISREGLDWIHELRGRADYQSSNGVATRKQFLLAYEPQFKIDERIYTYGLAQYEHAQYQGIDARYSVSGGLGYRVFDEADAKLLINGGPAWRRTEGVTGETSEMLAGLAAIDLDLQLAEKIKLTQDASAFVQSPNSTFLSVTGLEAGLGGKFSVRVAYRFEHDTEPPVGTVATDTLTRFTLIYGF